MKAIFTGFAAFAVVLAVQPAPQPGRQQLVLQQEQRPPAATAEQIEAAVEHAEAEAGRRDAD